MMETAFCPAHVTGFFKAQIGDGVDPGRAGSLGAGFSIREGVTTSVRVRRGGRRGHRITTRGHTPDDTRVSEHVVAEFFGIIRGGFFAEIMHEISVPVGYGLGCSGAVALSLAMALNGALNAGLSGEQVGQIAHRAEVRCKTGLGDVLASYHGGFEIRTRAGAPGVGRIEKIESEDEAILICFSPMSTRRFMDERMGTINGLGGRMVERLARTRDRDEFQDMSLEFAEYVRVMTPRMRAVIGDLRENGIRCGVALFGETVFTLVPSIMGRKVLEILGRHPGGTIIRSQIDNRGARMGR